MGEMADEMGSGGVDEGIKTCEVVFNKYGLWSCRSGGEQPFPLAAAGSLGWDAFRWRGLEGSMRGCQARDKACAR